MNVTDTESSSAARAWLTNIALVLIGFGLLLVTQLFVSEFTHFTIGFSGASSYSFILYAAAVGLILTQPVNRYTFGIILTVAIACRLVTLIPEPHLSSDIYRYVWDGVVQHAHISPYRYVPGDPALSFLREPHEGIFDHINRRDYAHTIYPPGAQMLFSLITFISPTVIFMKLAMILFEGLTMYALVRLLGELGVRREQSLLYAWCPLVIWEIGSSGHLDSAAMAFIVLALLARYRKQALWTGAFIAAAIVIKIYPIILLPALYRRGEYKMPTTVAAIALVAYGCYASVGMHVFGFLGGYVQEEGMQTGERYFVLGLAHLVPGLHNLPVPAYLAGCCCVFAALFVWCWRICCRQERSADSKETRWFGLPAGADFLVPAFALAFVSMLLFSPHYPWYIAWLVPFFTLVPSLTVFVYIGAFFYLCTTAIAVGYGAQQFLLNKILYTCVAIGLLVELVLRRWPLHQRLFPGQKRA
jgi:hypothetical protein